MERSKRTTLVVGIALLVVGVILGGYYLIQKRATETGAVFVPQLSAQAKRGDAAFGRHCASCHGQNAAGTDKGPPLVHRIYAPSHHGDVSFARAVTLGARQHHWLFGDMPPQPQVDRRQVDRIILYIRELQKANGIG